MKPRRPAKKPKAEAGTFQKLAPPRVPKPSPKTTADDAVAAMAAMIAKGRARQLAESLPDAALVSAGLADVTAQALQLFVLEKVKKGPDMTAEDAQFLFDVHQGSMQGITKAHDTIANSPFIPWAMPRDAEGRHTPAPEEPKKETRMSAALVALRSLERPSGQ